MLQDREQIALEILEKIPKQNVVLVARGLWEDARPTI
jgi:hypothetical protein